MKILIWKSHGNTEVYDISTPEKFAAVITDALEIVSSWGVEGKTVDMLQKHVEKFSNDWKELNRACNSLRRLVQSDDNFEEFTVSELK